METVLILQLVNGVLITLLKMREIEMMNKWREGSLSYDVLIACKKYKYLHVRKLNPHVKMGKYPGIVKKDD